MQTKRGLPLGAVLAGTGLLAGAAMALLRLDRLPWPICYFKALTGLPCPTCGSTRALGRLAALDLAGALVMNPLAALAAAVVLLWGAMDLVQYLRGRPLRLPAPGRRLSRVLPWLLLAAALVNWAYLVAMGR